MKINSAIIFLLLNFAFLISGCGKSDSSKRLILKDGLFYKEGSSVPFSGVDTVRGLSRIMVYTLNKGMRTGSFKILYEGGQPQIVGQLVNSINQGLWQYYYPQNKIESEGYFVDNLAEGTWRWYYQDGKISEQGNFVHGSKEGYWQQYDSTGKVSKIKFFVHGVEKNKK